MPYLVRFSGFTHSEHFLFESSPLVMDIAPLEKTPKRVTDLVSLQGCLGKNAQVENTLCEVCIFFTQVASMLFLISVALVRLNPTLR